MPIEDYLKGPSPEPSEAKVKKPKKAKVKEREEDYGKPMLPDEDGDWA